MASIERVLKQFHSLRHTHEAYEVKYLAAWYRISRPHSTRREALRWAQQYQDHPEVYKLIQRLHTGQVSQTLAATPLAPAPISTERLMVCSLPEPCDPQLIALPTGSYCVHTLIRRGWSPVQGPVSTGWPSKFRVTLYVDWPYMRLDVYVCTYALPFSQVCLYLHLLGSQDLVNGLLLPKVDIPPIQPRAESEVLVKMPFCTLLQGKFLDQFNTLYTAAGGQKLLTKVCQICPLAHGIDVFSLYQFVQTRERVPVWRWFAGELKDRPGWAYMPFMPARVVQPLHMDSAEAPAGGLLFMTRDASIVDYLLGLPRNGPVVVLMEDAWQAVVAHDLAIRHKDLVNVGGRGDLNRITMTSAGTPPILLVGQHYFFRSVSLRQRLQRLGRLHRLLVFPVETLTHRQIARVIRELPTRVLWGIQSRVLLDTRVWRMWRLHDVLPSFSDLDSSVLSFVFNRQCVYACQQTLTPRPIGVLESSIHHKAIQYDYVMPHSQLLVAHRHSRASRSAEFFRLVNDMEHGEARPLREWYRQLMLLSNGERGGSLIPYIVLPPWSELAVCTLKVTTEDWTCAICQEVPRHAVRHSSCVHMLCYGCAELQNMTQGRCPLCRSVYGEAPFEAFSEPDKLPEVPVGICSQLQGSRSEASDTECISSEVVESHTGSDQSVENPMEVVEADSDVLMDCHDLETKAIIPDPEASTTDSFTLPSDGGHQRLPHVVEPRRVSSHREGAQLLTEPDEGVPLFNQEGIPLFNQEGAPLLDHLVTEQIGRPSLAFPTMETEACSIENDQKEPPHIWVDWQKELLNQLQARNVFRTFWTTSHRLLIVFFRQSRLESLREQLCQEFASNPPGLACGVNSMAYGPQHGTSVDAGVVICSDTVARTWACSSEVHTVILADTGTGSHFMWDLQQMFPSLVNIIMWCPNGSFPYSSGTWYLRQSEQDRQTFVS